MFYTAGIDSNIHNCENCKNEDLCKWVGDMKIKQAELKDIHIHKLCCPISINISCDRFEKKLGSVIY